MSPRAIKLLSILGGLALAGIGLLTYTQTWIQIHASSPQGGTVSVAAAGSQAAPALSALSFAGLALFGAITIAGPVFRVILGALAFVLGGSIVLSAVLAVSDPIGSSATAITKVTGVDGKESVKGIVLTHSLTAWPWVSLVAGVALAVLGVFVIVTSKRWPASTRRYQAIRVVDPNAPADPVATWDTLTTGIDPTEVDPEPTRATERGGASPDDVPTEADQGLSRAAEAREPDDNR
ncbi:hypothetical protein GCM10025867_28880 [Frondihabitans sucicola]|uniref:Trp biosynthesis-associated membrane protein n=1 Tax=Frondihabitans sucicola TaxID=1268041 RepID=A0ABN6XZX9_9MICO|nr:Trp biosynthesis-associated membrane protein [Frondihabitans sucicola]BDZ50647.1 hypothetical protein GCM10025867_28880 [Frondihabitans sucicola]